jgi:hypothetical protein
MQGAGQAAVNPATSEEKIMPRCKDPVMSRRTGWLLALLFCGAFWSGVLVLLSACLFR